ncbi:MAG: hypothetical protein Q4G36_04060 [Paracoccus sp. (in: a-proteobacteria)]|nr:hypothetical protein [Paracoccus sp. (in: a-proteobacteria)]
MKFGLQTLPRRVMPAFALTLAPILALGFGAAPAQAQSDGCLDWQAEPYNVLRYSSEDLWTERLVEFMAGGSQDVMNCEDLYASGYYSSRPDFAFYYDAEDRGRMVRIKVTSDCDTTLVVNDAAGRWHYNDDDEGLNPALRFDNAGTGLYHIWMGTYGAQMCPATISFETF